VAAAQIAEYTKFRFIGELQKRLLFRTYKNVQMMVYVPKVPAGGEGGGGDPADDAPEVPEVQQADDGDQDEADGLDNAIVPSPRRHA